MSTKSQPATAPKFDAVTLEVLWNRLLSVAQEQQVALMRTAFSTIVRESQDLACGLFDTRGQMIAQSLTGTPGHINPMATGARHFLQAYPQHTLAPGDVLVTNDPWLTTGQVNDFTVLTPVFQQARIVGYFANCCHAADIGGRVLSAEAREVYEEGLRVPIMKLFDRGEPNHELFKIIRANVRTPDETVGDLYAQAACNDVGGRSLLALMAEFGLASIDPLADEIISRSERAMRMAIRQLPKGRYENEVWSDGFEEPIRIKVAVTIGAEDIEIDFAGSSPQSRRGINVVFNYTHGYASFAMKAAVSPEVPHNEGAFRPVHVRAPRGSILNCIEPAAVASRHLIGHFLPGAIFGALAGALPGRLMAGGADPIWLSIWRGQWPDREEPFMMSVFQVGGTGARAVKDGLTTTGFPSGVAGVPAEVIESLAPLIQHRRELRTDSGGAGAQRGGLGQWTEMSYRGDQPWSLSAMIDRTQFAGQGIDGGQPGALGEFLENGEKPLPPKTVVWFAPQSHVQLNLPGGGGYGDPLTREPERVLADVVNGYVSLVAAAADYGVVIHFRGQPEQLVRLPEDYAIDWAATEAKRVALRAR
ncbi:MAG: hydantoinase B/oxoprolinase family protein [Caldilineaceae bacterium]|nr:hydantoinase B/oxoprolinase family protein [Caldilineaceae bacterium]